MLIDVTITGLSPLLIHAIPVGVLFPDATTAAINGGEKKTPQQQAAASLYVGANGKPVVPAANVYKAIIEAGRFHKVGKRQLTTRDMSLVPSGIWIEETEIEIQSPEPYTVHSKMVTNEATKSKVPSHRPRWDKWSLSFTINVDTTEFGESLVRTLVNDAGRKIGIGSHRPERKGPFGRFSVTKWTPRKS